MQKIRIADNNNQPGKVGRYARKMRYYWQIYILMSVGILYFLIFKIVPLWGIGTAFVDFNINGGLLASKFVGFTHFTNFLNSPNFLRTLRNTMVISLMDLIFTFPAPIILSILLNEIRRERMKRLYQSLIYMPHFLSWAVIAALTFFLFSTDVGIVNKFIMMMGGEAVPLMIQQNVFWWLLLGQNIWKDLGWGTIVYLASISQIDQGLYEAAIIDGANRLQKMVYITVPSILPTVIVLFMMKLGRLMDVSFEQVWMMQNDMVRAVSETFETYSFLVGVQMGNFSVGTAVGLFKSVIGLGFVLLSNYLIKRSGHEGLY